MRRAKITAHVHIRTTQSEEAFEEVGTSIDASRDGLRFIGRNQGYKKGQLVEVIFPYSEPNGARSPRQRAEVIRVTEQPHGAVAVALHFCDAKPARQTEKTAPLHQGTSRQSDIAFRGWDAVMHSVAVFDDVSSWRERSNG
jgi:hypothetical protein